MIKNQTHQRGGTNLFKLIKAFMKNLELTSDLM